MRKKHVGWAGGVMAVIALLSSQYLDNNSVSTSSNQRHQSITKSDKMKSDMTKQERYLDIIPVFWRKLYSTGGETLYCGNQFGRHNDGLVNIEHIVPMSWAIRKLGCVDRKSCRRNNGTFNRLESDMHNLYPSLKKINSARGSTPFGVINGENRQFGACDFEISRSPRIVEPRVTVRGNIARAMFYMQKLYGIKINLRQGNLLKKWNQQDLPDAIEKRRNNIIEKLQGRRNPYIDNPDLADQLSFRR